MATSAHSSHSFRGATRAGEARNSPRRRPALRGYPALVRPPAPHSVSASPPALRPPAPSGSPHLALLCPHGCPPSLFPLLGLPAPTPPPAGPAPSPWVPPTPRLPRPLSPPSGPVPPTTPATRSPARPAPAPARPDPDFGTGRIKTEVSEQADGVRHSKKLQACLTCQKTQIQARRTVARRFCRPRNATLSGLPRRGPRERKRAELGLWLSTAPAQVQLTSLLVARSARAQVTCCLCLCSLRSCRMFEMGCGPRAGVGGERQEFVCVSRMRS